MGMIWKIFKVTTGCDMWVLKAPQGQRVFEGTSKTGWSSGPGKHLVSWPAGAACWHSTFGSEMSMSTPVLSCSQEFSLAHVMVSPLRSAVA